MATSLLSTDPVFVALEQRVKELEGIGTTEAGKPDTMLETLIRQLQERQAAIENAANQVVALEMRVEALENAPPPGVPPGPPGSAGPGLIVTTESEFRAALLEGGIILPRGEFRISSYLPVSVRHTRILGYMDTTHGPSRITIDNPDQNQFIFHIVADDVEIAYIELSGAQPFPTVSTPGGLDRGNHSAIAFGRSPADASLQKCHRFHLHHCHIHNLFVGFRSWGAPGDPPIYDVRIHDNWFHTFNNCAIQAEYSLTNIEIHSNLIEWRRPGETHVYHPNYPPDITRPAGDCLGVDYCSGARVHHNTCLRAYARWGIELFYCDDSICSWNMVAKCASGISMGDGKRNICQGNDISGADTGEGQCAVGSIEVVGSFHIIRDNMIWDGADGVKVPTGIVIQGGSAHCDISGNNISKVEVPIQVLYQLPSAHDIFIHHNVITLNDKVGEGKNGINSNGVPSSMPNRLFIENNLLIGPAHPDYGAILLDYSMQCYIKRNTHISPPAGGDDTIILFHGSEVYTDDANTLQTANPVTLHTNTRVDPTPPADSVTQDFDGYTAATSLATLPGWTVTEGAFTVLSGGMASANSSGIVCIAAYEPSGFTTGAHHQVEVTLGGTGDTKAQGAAIAIQSTGECYHCYADIDGNLYFGYGDGAGSGSDWLSADLEPFTYAGTKLRLTVSGTGASRVCTCEYNKGAGWVTPSGWNNRDFGAGKRLDAGKGGIAGYNNGSTGGVTSLTITNL